MKPIKMSIADIKKQSDEWKRTHYIMVYGPVDKEKPPKYFVDFQKEMVDFKREMLAFQKEMLEFKKQMLKFVKQQTEFNKFVLDQFKQHDWVK